jgi:hypothetical protein
MAEFLNLEDVEKTAGEHSDTFFIPSKKERTSQKVGDSVRLHFLLKDPSGDEPRAERMWVTVTQEQRFLQSYKGVLQSPPVYIKNLKAGDEIVFKSCHVGQTIIKKGDPRWIDSANLKTLVSRMTFEKNEFVRFLYRQKADRQEDSGWRMFTGHESKEYTDDPKNVRIVAVGYMLDRDPSLLEPLKEGIGAVYERKDKNTPWHRVVDWNPKE